MNSEYKITVVTGIRGFYLKKHASFGDWNHKNIKKVPLRN